DAAAGGLRPRGGDEQDQCNPNDWPHGTRPPFLPTLYHAGTVSAFNFFFISVFRFFHQNALGHTIVAGDFPSPYADRFSFRVQRQFASNRSFTTRVGGNREHRIVPESGWETRR